MLIYSQEEDPSCRLHVAEAQTRKASNVYSPYEKAGDKSENKRQTGLRSPSPYIPDSCHFLKALPSVPTRPRLLPTSKCQIKVCLPVVKILTLLSSQAYHSISKLTRATSCLLLDPSFVSSTSFVPSALSSSQAQYIHNTIVPEAARVTSGILEHF